VTATKKSAKKAVAGKARGVPGAVTESAVPDDSRIGTFIGANLRQQRQAQHLTMNDVADLSNISAGMLSRIENAQVMPSVDTLDRVCRVLGLSLSSLFKNYDMPEGLARFVPAGRGMNVVRRGAAAVLRTIPTKVLSLEELKCPKIFTEFSEYPRGIVLVTGPTGSGKSTTLAGMVNHINENEEGHILTIEDPIEFVHESKKCLINQREVGPHTLSFSNALRSALREDPDSILVGEMRDLETIRLALTGAETGHLVFGGRELHRERE
jgi:transcriptional regulator with XRE-family HTH domain